VRSYAWAACCRHNATQTVRPTPAYAAAQQNITTNFTC
jgi:hypothetical protein